MWSSYLPPPLPLTLPVSGEGMFPAQRSSELRLHRQECLPWRAPQQRLRRAIRIRVHEAVRADGADVFLVSEVGEVGLQRDFAYHTEVREAHADAGVQQ